MFKTFPEFSKLTLDDREEYEKHIKGYPPVGDISFAELMMWWNQLDSLSIAQLNGNLVIPYWLPGAEKDSGLSLIGKSKVDESICTIFDYLREKGEAPRLVNVPEFVISAIEYPDMFNFKEHRRYDEYLFQPSRFFPLENLSVFRRRRIEKKLREIPEGLLSIQSLDLGKPENCGFLLAAAEGWQSKNINNYGKLEREALKIGLSNPLELGLKNACLFVGEELHGFCLFQTPDDKDYMILTCVKATHKSVLGLDYIGYEFARWFAERGYRNGNFSSDYGILRLRMFLLALGPSGYFRKYTVEPV